MTTSDSSETAHDKLAQEPQRRPFIRLAGPIVAALALLMASLTFMILTGILTRLTGIQPSPEVVNVFLILNAAIILVLLGIIAHEVWQMIQARRRHQAAAELHVRIVSLFAIIAVLPAVLVAIIANLLVIHGFDLLFSRTIRGAIANSLSISRTYTNDHAQMIKGDIMRMAGEISKTRSRFDTGHIAFMFDGGRIAFSEMLMAQLRASNLSGAMIIDKNSNVLVQAGISSFLRPPPVNILDSVTENEPQLAVIPESSTIGGVIRLSGFQDTFLYVMRKVERGVVAQLKETDISAQEYAEIEARRLGMQSAFALIFAVIALTIILASVLTGLHFANWLIRRSAGVSASTA